MISLTLEKKAFFIIYLYLLIKRLFLLCHFLFYLTFSSFLTLEVLKRIKIHSFCLSFSIANCTFDTCFINVTVREQTWGGANDILLPKGPPLFLWGSPPPTRFTLPASRERCLSMPEIGEKERNYLFKSYTDLE